MFAELQEEYYGNEQLYSYTPLVGSCEFLHEGIEVASTSWRY